MTQANNLVILNGPDVYYTQTPMDAYRVERGTVFVYIVPWEKNRPGRRILLCESTEGRVIPAFAYQDSDYKQWRFAFVAKGEEAQLSVMENKVTSVLHRNFLRRAELDTYEQEGYENSLTEFYKREDVKDKAYIEKAQHSAPEAKIEALGAVKAAFSNENCANGSGNVNYQALYFVCSQLGISLIQADELISRCGKDPQITDIARASHFICRRVVLDANWHQGDCGGIVGKLNDEVVACVPKKGGKYQVYFTSDGRVETLTPEVAQNISPQAYSVGRTLPNKALSKKEVAKFCQGSIAARDMMPVVLLALVTALIGVLLPTLNQMIYDDYIPLGNIGNLAQMCVVMLSFMVGNGIVMALKGELRSDVAHELMDELTALATVGVSIKVDFTGVTYITSTILDVFLSVQQLMDSMRKGSLILCKMPAAIYQEFEKTGTAELLLIED